MGYIGHSNPLQIYPENTRDYIVPAPPQTTFILSQEVPGGYEGNVTVLKRNFVQKVLVQSFTGMVLVASGNTITVTDDAVAAALSVLLPGQLIKLEDSVSNSFNYKISTVAYTGAQIVLTLDASYKQIVADESSTSLKLSLLTDENWETLEPEVDYSIGGTVNYNKEITFAVAPKIEDSIYVIHRGSATYNFVPSASSVGPDQLSPNLRNFVVDRFTGNGSETNYTLSQSIVSNRSLVVTVNGAVSDGDDPLTSYTGGDWTVSGTTLTFKVAPVNLAKIKILHLGFSTISRRASVSDGQVGAVAPGTIDTTALASSSVTSIKIASNAVQTTHISADAVTGAKIRLDNNTFLRARNAANSADINLVGTNSSDHTIVNALTNTLFQIAGSTIVRLTATDLFPETSNIVSLGKNSNKFKDLHLQGNANIDGNVTVGGNIAVTGTVDGIDIAAAEGRITALETAASSQMPIGTVVMTARSTVPDANWQFCKGQAISRATYAALFTAISTTFGAGDLSTTFNVPNLQQRFPIGKTDTGGQVATNLGDSADGSPVHNHTLTHTHNVSVTGTLPDHTHAVGTLAGSHPHTHTMKNHTHGMVHVHFIRGHYHDSRASGATISIPSGGNHGHGLYDPGHSHTFVKRNNTNTPLTTGTPASSSGVGTDVGTAVNGSFTGCLVSDNVHGHANAEFSGIVGTTANGLSGDSGFYSNNPNISSGDATAKNSTDAPNDNTTDGASTSTVTISGSTGSANTLPGITSTGATTSQSTATSSNTTIPYIVMNFMIKVA